MRKIKPRHVIVTAVVLTGLAACSTAGAGSPGGGSSSPAAATSSATAPATDAPSTFTTGGPPSSSAPSVSTSLPADWNSPAHAKNFFAQIEPAATTAMQSTGIPASVLMAMAGQESAFGQTSVATQAHNLFAQACGKSAHCVGAYKWYKDWSSSIQAFASRMASSGVVQLAMQAFPGDVQKIAAAIASIQSLDPSYVQKVAGLIGHYKLHQSDYIPGF